MATVAVGCMCVQSIMVEGTCIMQIYNLKVIYCLRQFLLFANIMLPWQPYKSGTKLRSKV